MIVAGLVGMLLTLALLRNADQRVEVAVAAEDLDVGSVVEASAVRYERVKMDDHLLDTVLRPDDIEALDGAVVTSAIAQGELLSRSDVRPAATRSGLRAVSIPIDAARAVNGDLERGDRVDVILAAEKEVAIVVAGAEVLDVASPDGAGAFGAVGGELSVTLAVDARGAQLLAVAITDGDILLARSTGAEPAGDAEPIPIESVRPTAGAGG